MPTSLEREWLDFFETPVLFSAPVGSNLDGEMFFDAGTYVLCYIEHTEDITRANAAEVHAQGVKLWANHDGIRIGDQAFFATPDELDGETGLTLDVIDVTTHVDETGMVHHQEVMCR